MSKQDEIARLPLELAQVLNQAYRERRAWIRLSVLLAVIIVASVLGNVVLYFGA